MEVIVVDNEHEQASLVADQVEEVVRSQATPVIGVATGSSPLATYDELAARHNSGLSFNATMLFLLDEYVGLAPDHAASYMAFVRTNLASRIGVPDHRVFGPVATADDLDRACRLYEEAITEAGGIDLQILGIGTDGHIGFNEPTSSLASRTRVKTLTGRTRADNARFFDGDPESVPRHVLTQGIGTIMDAERVVLLASGEAKAEAVAAAVEGPMSAMVPASVLQAHPKAVFVLDRAAASKLRLIDYYQETYRAKLRLGAG